MKKYLLSILLITSVGLLYPLVAIAGDVYEGKALNSVEGDMDRARISVDTESGILRINFVAEGDRQSDMTLTYDQLIGVSAGEFRRSPGFMELMARGSQADYDATQFFIDYRTTNGEVKTTRVYVDDQDGRRFENEMEELVERARNERQQRSQQSQPQQSQPQPNQSGQSQGRR
jgi:hypothetical protein